jgi:hypothetical protein
MKRGEEWQDGEGERGREWRGAMRERWGREPRWGER